MKISRRKFILTALLATPCAITADARWLEPQWVKIHKLHLSQGRPTYRFVHFSDLHHKGDRSHTQSVVNMINSLSPDFVFFTGDIMEEGKYLSEALEILSGVKAPMFGVPGNHDYWSRVPFDDMFKCFAATGGAWLVDEERTIAGGKINLIGVARLDPKHPPPTAKPGMKNIVLFHYPAWAKEFSNQTFDLMLAGHSHGCQVRIPFYGPIMTPYAVDEYDLGLFQTKSGPLYVTSGIGWYPVPIRFNCRPEIVLIEV
ncbi:MAG TPA: metallophosphoesterase [Candidatus Limnocylindrales bacterium]|nr:metallophosphoesterase [Candidatus Limnocylindrales bacterium]